MTDIQSERHWYRLTHERSVVGHKGGRLYAIDCKKCKRTETLHAHNQSDEAMRKRVLRLGWQLGRFNHQHLCPECSRPQAPPAPAAEPASPPTRERTPFLQEAWLGSSLTEQIAFSQWLKAQLWISEEVGPPPEIIPPAPAVMVMSLQQAWEQASDTERKVLLDWYAPKPPPRLSLTESWSAADKLERDKLLRWLEQTCVVGEKNLTLLEYWNRATKEDRVRLLKYLHRQRLSHAHESVAEISDLVAQAALDTLPQNKAKIDSYPRLQAAQARRVEMYNERPAGTIGKSALARELGVGPPQVSEWIRRGLPVRADGLLDKDVAMAWLEAKRRRPPNRWRPPVDDAPPAVDVDNNFELTDDEAFRRLNKRLFGD